MAGAAGAGQPEVTQRRVLTARFARGLLLRPVRPVHPALRGLDLGARTAESIAAIYFFAFVLAFFGNAAYAPVLNFLNERFPTAIRASGTGLNWNAGFAIGGILPTFVTLLVGPVFESITTSVIFFVASAIVIYLVRAMVTPEARGKLGNIPGRTEAATE